MFGIAGLAGGIAVLIYLLGVAALVGFAVLFVALSVQVVLSFRTKAAERCNLGQADARLEILTEAVTGTRCASFVCIVILLCIRDKGCQVPDV